MLLEVDAFSLSFRRYDGVLRQRSVEALKALSFSVSRGEVLALIGASGAGKSLLAHALFGILPPNAVTTGALRLGGIALGPATLPRLRGRSMGLVPQSISHLDPLARCGQQLHWAAGRSGRRMDRTGLQALLAQFGLRDEVLKAFPHQLSGGMARRLMLALGTIGDPDLVVADEPTSGLDPDNAATILAHLRAMADRGRGVLLITHDLAQALPFADRVALLEHGQLVGIERAHAFSGKGNQLDSPYAHSLWRAMPQNDFIGRATSDA